MSVDRNTSCQFLKNKHESQQIHKKCKNKHRKSSWKCALHPREKTYFAKSPRILKNDPADLGHIIRACRGASVRDVTEILTFSTDVANDHSSTTRQPQYNFTPTQSDEKEQPLQHLGDNLLDWEWQCELCTYINWPGSLHCEICGDLNPYTLCTMSITEEPPQSPPRPTAVWRQFSDESRVENLRGNEDKTNSTTTVLSIEFLDLKPHQKIRKRTRSSNQNNDDGMKSKKSRRVRARKVFASWKSRGAVPQDQKKKIFVNRLEKRFYPKTLRQTMLQFSAPCGYAIHPLLVPERLKPIVNGFANGSRDFRIAFHGTNSKNLASIAKQGLLVGGRGCTKVHGAAYGTGVYCSPDLWLAKGYSGGDYSPIFVCAVLNYRRYGSIWVAPSENHILPCFVLTKYAKMSSMCNYGYLRIINARSYRGSMDNSNAFQMSKSAQQAVVKSLIYGDRWQESVHSGTTGVPYSDMIRAMPMKPLNGTDRNRRKRRLWA